MSDYPKLTPAQDQLMDLLVARTRLGEPFWPIDNAFRRTAKILEEKGLLTLMHGNVEGTFRASLSGEAIKIYITDSDFMPAIKREAYHEVADELSKRGGDPTTIRMIRKLAEGDK
jgi:hypothetical protein